jgi:hypothetical protein
MPEDIVVLIAYHEKPAVLELLKHHLERFRRFNPDVVIVPLTHATLERHPAWDYANMWRQADNIYYRWFLSRNRVEAQRYVWFDYDTWCNQSVREFLEPVWDAPFACAKHFAYHQHPRWCWFNQPQLLPGGEQCRNKETLHGVVPICGVFLSREVFAILVEEQVKEPATWRHVFSELRLGTILTTRGVPIQGNKNATGISATRRSYAMQLAAQGIKSIVHPVKAPV